MSSGGQEATHWPAQVLLLVGSDDNVYRVSPPEAVRYLPRAAIVATPIETLEGVAAARAIYPFSNAAAIINERPPTSRLKARSRVDRFLPMSRPPVPLRYGA